MIETYVRLLTESRRLETMERALAAAVRPGDVVADIGTGTGAFALFAARAGARRVFAVEREDVAALARELVAANGAADVVTVVQADASTWSPPEPLDVVVFEDIEDVGVGPVMGTLLPRFRSFLRPGGRFVPSTLMTLAAPAENAEARAKLRPWPDDRAFGLDLRPLMTLAREARTNEWVAPDGVLAPAQTLFTHEVGAPLSPSGHAFAAFTVARTGRLDGIVVWFDSVLAPGVTWSNGPAAEPTLWRQAFLPVPESPPVAPGDRVEIAVSYAPWGTEAQTWSWRVTVLGADGTCRHRGERSTFRSLPICAAGLRRRSLDHALAPGPRAGLTRDVLALFDGTRSAREIAAEISRRDPAALPPGDAGARLVLDILLPLAGAD